MCLVGWPAAMNSPPPPRDDVGAGLSRALRELLATVRGHSALSLAAVELEIHLRAMLTGGGGVRLRTAGRRFRGERIAKFLDSEQLGKWDSEVAKAKEFLGQKRDS